MGRLSAIILILLAVTAIFRIESVLYLVYVCVGLYVLGRWYTPRALANLDVQRVFADHAFLGDTIDVAITVENRSLAPLPWLQMSESVAPELRGRGAAGEVVSLRGRETATLGYTLYAARRGYHRIGPLHLSSGDLFGFFHERQRRHAPDFITVYPRITALAELGLPSRLPFGTIVSQQRLFEDPTRPAGVREFRSGDSLRRINWKVSAHTRSLMVKTFQPAVSLDTVILLNLHRGDYPEKTWRGAVEWGIEVAASFAAHLIDRRQAVGLITNGVAPLREAARSGDVATPPPIQPHPGRGQLMKILETLAHVDAADTVPFAQWAAPACRSLSWGMMVLAITATGDEATCDTLHRLVRTGFNPILFVSESRHRFQETRRRARRLGFNAYRVAGYRDLDVWRHRRVGVP